MLPEIILGHLALAAARRRSHGGYDLKGAQPIYHLANCCVITPIVASGSLAIRYEATD
jgi:hypothetical protein